MMDCSAVFGSVKGGMSANVRHHPIRAHSRWNKLVKRASIFARFTVIHYELALTSKRTI